MKHSQIVLDFLLPADQQASKAVEPGVRALHDPSSCAVAEDLTLLRLAPGWGRYSPKRPPALEPRRRHSLGPGTNAAAPPYVGSGRSTTMASLVGPVNFMACPLAPATARPMGMPCPSVSKLRLVPDLPPSVGWGPVPFPPTEPWLSPRPWTATLNPTRSSRRIPAPPPATISRTRRLFATPEIDHGRCWGHPNCEARPSTGSRSATP